MIREFFYLRRSDRKVVLALLFVIALATLIIYLAGGETDGTDGLTLADSTQNDSLSRRAHRSGYHRVDTVYLRPTYYRYPKQGRGRKSEREERVLQADAKTDSPNPALQPIRHKIAEGELVDLATADTTALMTVPGIGPYYARKIVQYGKRLGGYVSVSQLDEIEDFPTDAKRFLSVSSPVITKININKLSLSELRRHPYVNYYRARAITDYRRLHGPIKDLHDLSLSKDFPPEVLERLGPYVEY